MSTSNRIEPICGATRRVFRRDRTCELTPGHDRESKRVPHRRGSITWVEVSPEDGTIPDEEQPGDLLDSTTAAQPRR